jgi:hypothetical protein
MQETGTHIPNLCISYTICSLCITKNPNPDNNCEKCGENQKIFHGRDCQTKFCKWLFTKENKKSVCIAHNLKGYDGYFILKYLYDNAILPKIIYNGTKIMSMFVPIVSIKLIDSLNFLPMPLSKLPATFGFDELCKGYWPHFFNTVKNQNIILPHLPDKKFYGVNYMKSSDREKFIKWYSIHKNDVFDFKKEIIKYCQSDVIILATACIKFRDLFMFASEPNDQQLVHEFKNGIDPFQSAITIASACNLIFRTKYLKSESIGLIPHGGYNRSLHQSYFAKQWLLWIQHSKKISIQYETKIANHKVDGFGYISGKATIFEAYGCFYHGHPTCFSGSLYNPVCGKQMKDLYRETCEREKFLKSLGYKVESIWECDFHKIKESDSKIQKYLLNCEITEPLKPREAFFGGRCGASKLYHLVLQNEKIRYLDVCSLYPWVCKYCKFPVGHPEVFNENIDVKNVKNYCGLIKCKVLPPRKMFHPVLPVKMHGKLLFPLCYSCCLNKNVKECNHLREERCFIGTWVSEEIILALENGYKIQKIYEIWHYPETSKYDPSTKMGGLFTKYINAFLKLKQESSGWPSWVKTDEDCNKYIDEYMQKEGIKLDENNICINKGLRSLAKLCLNSFWGKFGQRNNLRKTTHTDKSEDFFSLISSEEKIITNVTFPTAEIAEIQWEQEENFASSTETTNVVLAAFTTAHARIALFKILEKLGTNVCYYDTDSVIYIENNQTPFIPTGDFLGDLTDEIEENNHIVEFVSGGPKNYAYKLYKPNSDGHQYICKVKGISLNFSSCKIINFESIKNMVHHNNKKYEITNPCQISRNKNTTNIISSPLTKTYQFQYDKRVIRKNFLTYPYGY